MVRGALRSSLDAEGSIPVVLLISPPYLGINEAEWAGTRWSHHTQAEWRVWGWSPGARPCEQPSRHVGGRHDTAPRRPPPAS